MTNKTESATAPVRPPLAIDWREVVRAAIGSAFVAGLVGGALHVLSMIDEESRAAQAASGAQRRREYTTPEQDDDDTDDERDAEEAAALLGIGLDADVPEIRAALRRTIVASRAHPDRGGDADGDALKKLVAARDLLSERARAVRS